MTNQTKTTIYGRGEIEAVRTALDAVVNGMCSVMPAVKQDHSVKPDPDDEAAESRLKKVLDALHNIYTRDLIQELFDELYAQ